MLSLVLCLFVLTPHTSMFPSILEDAAYHLGYETIITEPDARTRRHTGRLAKIDEDDASVVCLFPRIVLCPKTFSQLRNTRGSADSSGDQLWENATPPSHILRRLAKHHHVVIRGHSRVFLFDCPKGCTVITL